MGAKAFKEQDKESRAPQSSVAREGEMHASGAEHPVLAVQRSHGNRFVRQALVESAKADAETETTPDVNAWLKQARQPDRALDNTERAPLQSLLGADFGHVRVHEGDEAASLNRALGARAFTFGQEVFFGRGEYERGDAAGGGASLLAHELSHTIRQRGQTPSVQRAPANNADAAKPPDLTAELAERERGLLGQYGAFLPGNFRMNLAGANLGVGFGVGFVDGIRPFVPREQVEAFSQGMRDPRNFLLLQVGQRVGMIIGAGEDLYNNIAGLVELAGMGIKAFGELPTAYKLALSAGPLAPALIAGYEGVQLLRGDPETIARQRRLLEIMQALWKFQQYVEAHPDAFLSVGEELGRHAGQAFGEEISDRVLNEPDYYWRGVAIGRWMGMILMEVALLFVGPEEWILRGAAAAGEAGVMLAKTAARGLRETRLGEKVLSILREIPELSKLLRAAHKSEEAAHGVVAGARAAGSEASATAGKVAEGADSFVVEGAHTPVEPEWARAADERAIPFEADPAYGAHLTEGNVAPGAEVAAGRPPHGAMSELEPHRAAEVGDVDIPSAPRGFNSGVPAGTPKKVRDNPKQFAHLYTGGRAPVGRKVKAGGLKVGKRNVLEPTRYNARKLPPNHLKSYLQRYGLTFGAEGRAARESFELLRPTYQARMGMKPGEQIHHAIELQVLDYYPDVFTPAELNAIGNMRGIPHESLVPGGPKGTQLHQSMIAKLLDERYRQLDRLIESHGYLPGYPDYNRLVREHLEAARREVDELYGHLFRWPMPESSSVPFVGSALGKAGMAAGEER